MDHSHMDHGDMGHTMPAMCSMNMLFTWDTKNLCIVFRSWHITSTTSLLFSLVAVVLLTAGYEAIREGSRRYEEYVAKSVDELPHGENITERTPFLWSGRNQVEVSKKAHVIKALLYGIQVFYSFFLMLLFMTYNGWVMLAVGIGATLGFLFFGKSTTATKVAACH